jgi:prepilin-type N-terminal cleavage/methylation domain-containing protein
MKIAFSRNRKRGMTLIELCVVLVVVGFITIWFISAYQNHTYARNRILRIQCVNNLKQVGLAFRVWEGDHGDKYPMAVSEKNGGTMEFITGQNAFRHFQVMSNELSTPIILNCPSDDRGVLTHNWNISNSNLSYFVGVDAAETNAQMILSGDYNITNGNALRDGMMALTTNQPLGWTVEIHKNVGNLLLADGSVQQMSVTGLRAAVANTGFATNRLQMPILGP